MEVDSIVIVSLTTPKEKVWGLLLALNSAGITVRGIQLDSFDDFIRQILDREEASVGPTTVFYPMHRVERIAAQKGMSKGTAEEYVSTLDSRSRDYLRFYFDCDPDQPTYYDLVLNTSRVDLGKCADIVEKLAREVRV